MSATQTPKFNPIQRFAVAEGVRLSVSSWERVGVTTYAVALDRLGVDGKWHIDSATAAEFSGKDAEDMAYRSTDFGAGLVAGVLGQCPARFFRDNHISKA